MPEQPETRYAKSGELNIAYQVLGDGPLDLVFVPGLMSHIDLIWTFPATVRFFRRLASFSRLILYDKRGQGVSDPPPGVPTLEQDERLGFVGEGFDPSSLLVRADGDQPRPVGTEASVHPAVVPRLRCSPRELDVLLRHRPPSTPRPFHL